VSCRSAATSSRRWAEVAAALLRTPGSRQCRAVVLLAPGSKLGEVGNTGDAAGRPTHLHYAILSLVPRPWHIATGAQGWKRMFFVDPGKWLTGG